MAALTTRQRDILRVLLEASRPLGTAEIASLIHLSPRQVNYSLKGVKKWLAREDITLKVTPGVGVQLVCAPAQLRLVMRELNASTGVQLVLTAGQRQQLLALILLASDEPLILLQIQQLVDVSRATILKDLDEIESWLNSRDISLVRKPNYGVQVEADELVRQQALAALVWGEMPFGESLTAMTHGEGLVFSLKVDADLLPIVQRAIEIFSRWGTQRVTGIVAYAEEQLGGRFTDDAVLHLSLALAILTDRVQSGCHLELAAADIEWLRSLPVWPVARNTARRVGWHPSGKWGAADIAGIAMLFLAAPRSEVWPGDKDLDLLDNRLIDRLIAHVCQVYNQPDLCEDRILRDSLVNHLVPACLRKRFRLWYPSIPSRMALPNQYAFEYQVAGELVEIVREQTGYDLPESEISNIAMLLRAAYIRARPYRFGRVIVVCPSGMATAQLLVARLEARFPRLGNFEVVSLRSLGPEVVASADLILTTVPLPAELVENCKILQVHPLLMPEDVDAITRFLS